MCNPVAIVQRSNVSIWPLIYLHWGLGLCKKWSQHCSGSSLRSPTALSAWSLWVAAQQPSFWRAEGSGCSSSAGWEGLSSCTLTPWIRQLSGSTTASQVAPSCCLRGQGIKREIWLIFQSHQTLTALIPDKKIHLCFTAPHNKTTEISLPEIFHNCIYPEHMEILGQ